MMDEAIMDRQAAHQARYAEARAQLETLNIPLPQIEAEFAALCAEVAAARPQIFVEVGTRDGGSLWMLARHLPPEATVVSIDLPGAVWGRSNSGANKARVVAELKRLGYTVHLIEADSQLPETAAELRSILGGTPIDFLFIDADHRWRGVLNDWKNYAPMVGTGGMIGFHDIIEHPTNQRVRVFLLWEVLKTLYRHREWVADPTRGMGIGLLWKAVAPGDETELA